MSNTDPFPARDTQQWRLLTGLLSGDKITPITAILDYNVFIPAARCAELRKLGWPVRKQDIAHPNHKAFPGAVLPAYFLDAHFRVWVMENEGKHPSEYPFKEGRGKFVGSEDGK